jgi:copper transport protein
LRRSVLTEAALAVVVLTVTTMLVATPPGRAADTGAVPAGAPAADGAERIAPVRIAYDTGGATPGARGTATLTLDPAKGGGHTVRLLLRDADGRPADVPEVRLAFTLPARDLGPLRVPLRPQAPGGWSGPVRLTLAGDWTVSLTVRSSGIDQGTSTGRLTLGG